LLGDQGPGDLDGLVRTEGRQSLAQDQQAIGIVWVGGQVVLGGSGRRRVLAGVVEGTGLFEYAVVAHQRRTAFR
jgi:hypothetical protein